MLKQNFVSVFRFLLSFTLIEKLYGRIGVNLYSANLWKFDQSKLVLLKFMVFCPMQI